LLAVDDMSGGAPRLMEVCLVDVLLNGIDVCGTMLLVHAPAFHVEKEEELDTAELEKKILT